MNNDCIFIENLEMDAIIGVLAHERVQPQPVQLDLSLYFDVKTAGTNDALPDTIDYADICEKLTAFISQSKFNLIEKLADSICEWLFHHYPMQKIRLTLRKPEAIAQAKSVGVMIERQRPTNC